MIAGPGRLLLPLLVGLLFANPLVGQDAVPNRSDSAGATRTEEPQAGEPSMPLFLESALDWASDGQGRVPTFTYGGAFTQGYSSIRDRNSRADGYFAALNATIGFGIRNETKSISFRYDPFISLHAPEFKDVTAYQRSHFDMEIGLSRNWLWGVDAATEYGDESARMLGASTPTHNTLNPMALVDPSSLAWGRLSDSVFGALGSTGVSWHKTRRQELSFTVADSHFTRWPEGTSSSAVSGALRFRQKVTTTFALSAYGQIHRYLDSNCPGISPTSYGIGVGAHLQIGHNTFLSGEAGPQYGGVGCGRRWVPYFGASLKRDLPGRMIIAISAKRDLSATYVFGNRWADTIIGKLARRTSTSTWVELSGGYLHSGGAQPQSGSYSNFTVSPQFRWELHRSFDLVAGYRHSQRDTSPIVTGEMGLKRDWVFISIGWHPTSVESGNAPASSP